MTDKIFTLGEATALLPRVRELVETLQEAQRAMEERHDEVMSSVPTNGGGAVHRAFFDASKASSTALNELTGLGVIVRDPANGLVDFPTERDGQPAFLCWKAGEDRIAWWHPTETGFSGRQPL
jgi:hypothetical protein